MQIKLPTKEKVEKNEFKEPLKNWRPVKDSEVPSWRKELLPDEEVMQPSDWRPPTPPRVDISLQLYKQEYREETPKLPKIRDIVQEKEIMLREDFAENDEVVLFNNSCIIRTTKAGIKKSKMDRQDEEEEQRKSRNGQGWGFGDRGGECWGGRGGRDGGGRGVGGGGFMVGRAGGSSGLWGGGRDRDRFGSLRYSRFQNQRHRSISSSPGREASSDSFDRSGRRHSSPHERQSSYGRREDWGRAGERRESYGQNRSGGREEGEGNYSRKGNTEKRAADQRADYRSDDLTEHRQGRKH